MAGNRFVLRDKDTQENPSLARFYGDGITATKVVVYAQEGTRTKFIGLIAQGARFQGDTGCSKVRRCYYGGFEIPEFDSNGARNWKFHKGYQTRHPVYRLVTMSDAGDVVNDNGHPYNNGDLWAFHNRGDASLYPSALHPHTQYRVVNKTANTYQLSLTEGGAAIVFDRNSTGTILGYKAENVGFFDNEQGRPFFFPTLDFTFSGKSYFEILLPAELSNGEDEPTRLKLVCRGKEVYNFVADEDGFLTTTGTPLDSENPALISFDFLRNDNKLENIRFNATTWIAWRNRCDELILWEGGNENPSFPNSFPVIQNGVYSPESGQLLATAPSAKVFTPAYSERNASMECKYQGGTGDFELIFVNAPNDSSPSHQKHGIIITPAGVLYFTNGVQVRVLGNGAVSDSFKIAYESGFFKVYKNSIPVSMFGINGLEQPAGDFYGYLGLNATAQRATEIKVFPSGTSSAPRQVKRFNGDFVTPVETPCITAFEAEVAMCPGISWQDADGEISILTTPDRVPVFRFTKSNTSKLKIKQRDITETANYWRFSYRNKDDYFLTRAYGSADRPKRRRQAKRKIENGGILQFGVLTPSQMDRIGETMARVIADNDFGFDIEGFLDSLIVCKGDFVEVVDELGGFPDDDPCLCMVLGESFDQGEDVESRSFDVQVITPDFYSDTAHGAVVPVTRTTASERFIPAPFVNLIELQESSRRLPDGTYIPVIDGLATFNPALGQTGKVFIKRAIGNLQQITPVHGTNTFTVNSLSRWTFAEDDAITITPISFDDLNPSGISYEDKLFIRNFDSVSGTFQVSKTLGGAILDFTDNGSGAIYAMNYSAWQDTNIRLVPDPVTLEAGFQIENIQRGIFFVRVQSFSSGGISYDFKFQTTEEIFIEGDTLIPQPPPRLDYFYDGVNIRFQWLSSPSPNVSGYILKDEFETVFYQGDARSFVMPARTTPFTVRVFAYSFSSVVSSESASVIFVPPVLMYWLIITGGTISSNSVFSKSAGDGWGNCGAILNKAILTNQVEANLGFPIDRTDQYRVFGFSKSSNINGLGSFDWAVYLLANGTIQAVWQDFGTQQLFIGVQNIGDKIILRFLPPVSSGDNGKIRVIRQTNSGGTITEEMLHQFDTEVVQYYPLYAGVALYTSGDYFPASLELSGDLIPSTGTIPSMHNQTGTTFNPANGNLLSTAINSGASSVNRIELEQDGEFRFTVDPQGGYIWFGLTTNDDSTVPEDIPFAVRYNDDYETILLIDGVPTDLGVHGIGTVFSFSRENGVPCFRLNGHLEWKYDDAPSELKTDPLYLDVSFAQAESTVQAIRIRNAAETTFDSSGNLAPVVPVFLKGSKIGENEAYMIPKFNAPDSQTNDILVFDGDAYVNRILTDSDIPNIPASKITSGTIDPARLGSGSSITSKFLRGDSTWQTVPVTSPAGANTQIQFNSSGVFGASANFTYDGKTVMMKSSGLSQTENLLEAVRYDSSIAFKVARDSVCTFGADYDYANALHAAQHVFKYAGAGVYSGKGLKLNNLTNGAIVRLHALSGNSLYLTDDTGTAASLALATRLNPADASTFTASSGRWIISSGGFVVNNASWAGFGQIESYSTSLPQMVALYNSSNYEKTTVASNGATTREIVGSAPSFSFKNKIKNVTKMNEATSSFHIEPDFNGQYYGSTDHSAFLIDMYSGNTSQYGLYSTPTVNAIKVLSDANAECFTVSRGGQVTATQKTAGGSNPDYSLKILADGSASYYSATLFDVLRVSGYGLANHGLYSTGDVRLLRVDDGTNELFNINRNGNIYAPTGKLIVGTSKGNETGGKIQVRASSGEQIRKEYSAAVYTTDETTSSGDRIVDIVGASPRNVWKDKGRFEKELERQGGTSSKYAQVGGVLKEFYSDVQSTAGIDQNAFGYTIEADLMNVNGDKVSFDFYGLFANNSTIKAVRLKLGTNVLFDSDDLTDRNGWNLQGFIIRESSSIVRSGVMFSDETVRMVSSDRFTSGVDFTTNQTLQLVIYADDTDSNNIAKSGVIEYKPKSV